MFGRISLRTRRKNRRPLPQHEENQTIAARMPTTASGTEPHFQPGPRRVMVAFFFLNGAREYDFQNHQIRPESRKIAIKLQSRGQAGSSAGKLRRVPLDDRTARNFRLRDLGECSSKNFLSASLLIQQGPVGIPLAPKFVLPAGTLVCDREVCNLCYAGYVSPSLSWVCGVFI